MFPGVPRSCMARRWLGRGVLDPCHRREILEAHNEKIQQFFFFQIFRFQRAVFATCSRRGERRWCVDIFPVWCTSKKISSTACACAEDVYAMLPVEMSVKSRLALRSGTWVPILLFFLIRTSEGQFGLTIIADTGRVLPVIRDRPGTHGIRITREKPIFFGHPKCLYTRFQFR